MENEVIMQKAFWEQASQVFDVEARPKPCPQITRAGAELELFLSDACGKLASDSQKRHILNETSAGIELGAAAVEIHPGPIHLIDEGFSDWLGQLTIEQDAVISAAKQQGLLVGRCGLIPWSNTSNIERSLEERYQLVPDFHNEKRTNRPELGNIYLGGAEIVGLTNSFQFSIEAANHSDSLDKLNRLFTISPWAVALGANAPLINCANTNWADCRFEAWKITHDTRDSTELKSGKTLRIGLPTNFYTSIKHYLEDVSSHPFILYDPDLALQIGIGLFWRDARIKLIDNAPVVEFRPLSIQPSLEEDLALASFVIGRLAWSQLVEEPLLDMATVRFNKKQAEEFGIRASFICNGKFLPVNDLLSAEIDKARIGLRKLELLDNCSSNGLRLLQQRVSQKLAPSDQLIGLDKEQLIRKCLVV